LASFVYLGATNVLAATNDIDGGFLAAHQLTQDFVNQAFLNERDESFRGFHGRTRWYLAGDAGVAG
jgi:hypothetical protein